MKNKLLFFSCNFKIYKIVAGKCILFVPINMYIYTKSDENPTVYELRKKKKTQILIIFLQILHLRPSINIKYKLQDDPS